MEGVPKKDCLGASMSEPSTDAPEASTEPTYEERLSEAATKVASQVRPLIDTDQVVELRALKVQDKVGATWAGTFRGDELHEMCKAALNLSGNCQGVYFTLNPLKPERLATKTGSARVARRGKGQTACETDVLLRRWVLVDVDPVRAKGMEKESATDEEKVSAWEVMQAARDYLVSEEDWPEPILSDSGNGYHLLFRLEQDQGIPKVPVPEDDPIRLILRELAGRFNTPAAHVDTAVFNPARIVKFPGTLACKGSGEGDRPHRRARVLEVP